MHKAPSVGQHYMDKQFALDAMRICKALWPRYVWYVQIVFIDRTFTGYKLRIWGKR